MPGIVGFTQPDGERGSADAEAAVGRMQRAVTHRSFYQLSDPLGDSRVAAAVSLLFPQSGAVEANTYQADDVSVWMHGELLDGDRSGSAAGSLPAERLAERYRQHDDFGFLSRVDGLFAAVIYDRRAGRIHLATDRLGLKFLFWSRIDGQLVWSTEVKAFLEHPGFEPTIDEGSLDDFFTHGQMRGESSWFDGVELVPPGSVVSYDLSTADVRTTRYWSWDDLEGPSGSDQPEDFEAAVRRMGALFRRAVARRCETESRMGLGLSGGLDSRAILAALPDEVRQASQTFTFGLEESPDARIARQIATRFGLQHRMFPIDETTWFEGNYEAVWLTDGHSPVRHMHSTACLHELPSMFDVNLNGFLGDAIQGGFYLVHSDEPLVEVVRHRGRRLINQGVRLFEAFRHNRRPFLDNELVAFTLSLPEEWLADGRLYQAMLQREFPAFFDEIPSASTGAPIGWPAWRSWLRQWWRDTVNNVRSLVPGAGQPTPKSYVDYHAWLGGPSYRAELEEILFDGDPLYREYLPDLPVEDAWSHLVAGEVPPNWRLVPRTLTFEIWLNQVYEGRWRPTES